MRPRDAGPAGWRRNASHRPTPPHVHAHLHASRTKWRSLQREREREEEETEVSSPHGRRRRGRGYAPWAPSTRRRTSSRTGGTVHAAPPALLPPSGETGAGLSRRPHPQGWFGCRDPVALERRGAVEPGGSPAPAQAEIFYTKKGFGRSGRPHPQGWFGC